MRKTARHRTAVHFPNLRRTLLELMRGPFPECARLNIWLLIPHSPHAPTLFFHFLTCAGKGGESKLLRRRGRKCRYSALTSKTSVQSGGRGDYNQVMRDAVGGLQTSGVRPVWVTQYTQGIAGERTHEAFRRCPWLGYRITCALREEKGPFPVLFPVGTCTRVAFDTEPDTLN